MSGNEGTAGARIARARRRRGLSQSVLAGLVGRSESWLSQVKRAMMGYEAVSVSIGGREPGATATAAHLRARASAAYAGYQATRYDDTGRMLPALIREAEAAGGDNRVACSVRMFITIRARKSAIWHQCCWPGVSRWPAITQDQASAAS